VGTMRKIVFWTMIKGPLLATGANLFLLSFKRFGDCVQNHNYVTYAWAETRESHVFADDNMEQAHKPKLKDIGLKNGI